MTTSDIPNTAVLRCGDRPLHRSLAGLPVLGLDDTDTALAAGFTRLVVVGSQADLAAVLTRLLRADRLDVEVGHAANWRAARRARRGAARRVPLIRDETGQVIVGAGWWLPVDGAAALRGEAVVDDAVLFDGEVAGVRVEPTATQPGLRAAVIAATGRRGRWVTGRAAQLGTTGASVVRDGVPGARPVRRSTFYRHLEGWLRVR